MKNFISSFAVVLTLGAAIVVLSSVYTVSETQQVVVTQFGEPIGAAIQRPGLKFKTPFVQEANFIEKRILEWDGDANRVPTKDKRYIWVDATARWRILEPLLFMQSVRNQKGAQQRLDAILDGTIRNVISEKPLIEVVRSSNRILDVVQVAEVEEGGEKKTYDSIPKNSGRVTIQNEILQNAKAKLQPYGIELVDVLIKRLNYEQEVQQKVYDRMISERKRVADRYRSEGESERARIEGLKEKEMKRISSEAYRQSEIVRGKADAEAIQIYAEAYNRDPEFYAFLKTLESYRRTLDGQTSLIMQSDNPYFSYFQEGKGQ